MDKVCTKQAWRMASDWPSATPRITRTWPTSRAIEPWAASIRG